MKVHIGGLEITVDNIDELDQLVQRYGQADSHAAGSEKSHADAANGQARGNGNGGAVAADRVVLQQLLEHADTGIHTNNLGDLLGRRGKAVKPALMQWALRIGLLQEGGADPFEKARPGGGRGWRLKPTLVPVARQLLADM